MSIQPFLSVNNVVFEKLLYLELVVEQELPTPLQWKFAMEDMKQNLNQRVQEDIPFAFILDLRKMGFIPLSYVREFVDVLEKQSVILEKRLVATSVITEGTLIASLFEIMKMFYKTKKPLKFVKDLDEARTYVREMEKESAKHLKHNKV